MSKTYVEQSAYICHNFSRVKCRNLIDGQYLIGLYYDILKQNDAKELILLYAVSFSNSHFILEV